MRGTCGDSTSNKILAQRLGKIIVLLVFLKDGNEENHKQQHSSLMKPKWSKQII